MIKPQQDFSTIAAIILKIAAFRLENGSVDKDDWREIAPVNERINLYQVSSINFSQLQNGGY